MPQNLETQALAPYQVLEQGAPNILNKNAADKMAEMLKGLQAITVDGSLDSRHDLPIGGKFLATIYHAVDQSYPAELLTPDESDISGKRMRVLKLEEIDQFPTEDRQVLRDKLEEVSRISRYAPRILGAVLKSNMVYGIMPEDVGKLVYDCCVLAQNPNRLGRVGITVGSGGTEDEVVSLRIVTHILPAVQMVQELNKVADYIEQTEQARQERTVNGETKGVMLGNPSKAVTQIPDRPKLRLLWAPNAAKTLSHKDAAKVDQNATLQMAIVHEFLSMNAPDVLAQTTFVTDKPWTEMDVQTQQHLQAGARYLETVQDKRVVTAIQILHGRGENHVNGGTTIEQKQALARIYMTAHAGGFFEDEAWWNLCLTDNASDTMFAFSVGPRAEAPFNIVRDHLTHYSQQALPQPEREVPLTSVKLISRHARVRPAYLLGQTAQWEVTTQSQAVSVENRLRELTRVAYTIEDNQATLSVDEMQLLGLSESAATEMSTQQWKLLVLEVKSALYDYASVVEYMGINNLQKLLENVQQVG